MRQRRTLAALATLVMILVLVILPLTLITALLVQEGAGVYERIQSGEFDIGRYFQQAFNALPGWVTQPAGPIRADEPGPGAGEAVGCTEEEQPVPCGTGAEPRPEHARTSFSACSSCSTCCSFCCATATHWSSASGRRSRCARSNCARSPAVHRRHPCHGQGQPRRRRRAGRARRSDLLATGHPRAGAVGGIDGPAVPAARGGQPRSSGCRSRCTSWRPARSGRASC